MNAGSGHSHHQRANSSGGGIGAGGAVTGSASPSPTAASAMSTSLLGPPSSGGCSQTGILSSDVVDGPCLGLTPPGSPHQPAASPGSHHWRTR